MTSHHRAGSSPRFSAFYGRDVETVPGGDIIGRTIGRAGYWPDVARDQPAFNRPNWHYQLGSTLTIGDNVKVHATSGALPAGSDLETRDLHIAQAIELCRQTLRGSGPDSDKAIAICWLAHLVADSHQPYHAGSLYVDGIFPEGDRGANSIPTKQGRNLHALWDGLLGGRYDAGDIARRAKEIKSDNESWQAAEVAGTTVEPLEWLRESSEFGKAYATRPRFSVLSKRLSDRVPKSGSG